MARTVFVMEAAAILGVSRRTVYYRIRDGRLRTVRTTCGTRRVLMESIEALLREEYERTGAVRDEVVGANRSGSPRVLLPEDRGTLCARGMLS